MKARNRDPVRTSVFATSALVLMLAASFANAGPLVTQWGYSTSVTFSDATWNQGTNAEPYGDGTTIATGSELSWGVTGGNFQSPNPDPNNATNRSALTAGNVATGALTGGVPATSAQLGRPVALGYDANITGDEIGRGTSFTHWNNPIWDSYDSLAGAKITDTISLFPIVNADGTYNTNPEITGPTLIFNFSFLETTNSPQGGFCADGSQQTSVYPGGCPDLFGYQGTQVLNQAFTYDGNDYFIQFLTLTENLGVDTIGVQQLAAGECDVLGLDPGCYGFRTLEGTETTARFGFAITSEPIDIPEPASLALLAMGLLGLGATVQRKRAA